MPSMPVLVAIAGTAVAIAAGGLLLAGIGLLFLRLAGGRESAGRLFGASPWIGFAIILLLLQVWHLLLPVNPAARWPCAGLGVVGLAAGAAAVRAHLRRLGWGTLAAAALGFVALLWLAAQATRQATLYDMGLYHASAVRWAVSYPEVPGIGNLHDRLAFNTSYFLYAGLFDAGTLAGRYHHVATPLLVFLVLGRAIVSATELWRDLRTGAATAPRIPDGAATPGSHALRGRRTLQVYDLLVLGPLIPWIVKEPYFNSVSPDAALWLVGFALGRLMLQMIVEAPAAQEYAPAIVLLCAAGGTLKLSFAPFAAFGLLTAWLLLPAGRRMHGLGRRLSRVCLGAAVVLVAVFAWRGVVQSGHLAFPSSLFGFDVDWRVPDDACRHAQDGVVGWARMPDATYPEALSGWGWLRPWLVRTLQNPFLAVLPFVLFVAGVLALLCESGSHPLRRASPKVALLVAAPFAHVAFVLVTAPDWRFTGASPWLLALWPWALVLGSLGSAWATLACGGAFTILLAGPQVDAGRLLWRPAGDPDALPCGETRTETTRSGLVVRIPVAGNQCWDAPLPCAPSLRADLEERSPASLAGGYRVRPSAE